MDKNQGDSIIFNSSYYNLPMGNQTPIYRSCKKVSGVNNLVLAVQIDNLEYPFLKVPR